MSRQVYHKTTICSKEYGGESEVARDLSLQYPDTQVKDEWAGDEAIGGRGFAVYQNGQIIDYRGYQTDVVEITMNYYAQCGRLEHVEENIRFSIAIGLDVPEEASSNEIIICALRQYIQDLKDNPRNNIGSSE